MATILSTSPILYSFRRCPYAMRARMALHYAGIDIEHREIDLKNKPSHMLKISPKGTVPVMQLTDGSVLEESLDIMHWALSQDDPDGWLGSNKESSYSLIDENDGPFKQSLDRYKYSSRFPDEDCSDSRNQGEYFLEKLDSRLQQTKYLVSDSLTIADIAIFPFVRQFANVDKNWFYSLSLNHLQIWLTERLESPLFLDIMKKHKLYKE